MGKSEHKASINCDILAANWIMMEAKLAEMGL